MKPIQLISSVFVLFAIIVFYGCEGDKIEGTFYLSDQARKYQIDTAMSFKMIDNHGITEDFYIDKYIWYSTHHFFSDYGNGIIDETFGVAYYSSINNYSFMYVLRY